MRMGMKSCLKLSWPRAVSYTHLVCALGQGTWKMGKSALREAEEVEALRAGIELGMSVVDTAEMYGNEEWVLALIHI